MTVDFINSSYRRFYKANKKQIDKAIQNCLSKGELTLRKEVWDLEKNFAKFVGSKYAVSVNSGTDALFLSLKALDIGPGDEVITVSNTFIATIQAIVNCGANPILIDVGHNELINPCLIAEKITKNTKAIIPVQYTGAICDMELIKKIVTPYKIYIVDDACQAVGAGGAGTFGILNCFSFNTAKLMGGLSDGGIVTTNDRKLYEKICLLRNHWNIHQLSVDKNDYPQPTEMQWAWKSRLSNINAAFLNVKFKTIKQILKRREEIAERYNHEFSSLSQIKLPIPFVQNRENRVWGQKYYYPEQDNRVWQEYHLRVKNTDRPKLAKYLQKKGIEILIRDSIPNHKMKGLGLGHFNLPITEILAQEIIRLPLHEWLTDKEVSYIIESVKKFYAKTH